MFLCGCFVSLTHLYPPKSNSWLRPWGPCTCCERYTAISCTSVSQMQNQILFLFPVENCIKTVFKAYRRPAVLGVLGLTKLCAHCLRPCRRLKQTLTTFNVSSLNNSLSAARPIVRPGPWMITESSCTLTEKSRGAHACRRKLLSPRL